jgi:hypothetical protein
MSSLSALYLFRATFTFVLGRALVLPDLKTLRVVYLSL